MDVRVLIAWHPGNVFQVSVIALEAGRRWRKLYPSKEVCVDELWRLGLLTLVERYDALHGDFATQDKALVIQTTAEALELEEAGFVETTRQRVNEELYGES